MSELDQVTKPIKDDIKFLCATTDDSKDSVSKVHSDDMVSEADNRSVLITKVVVKEEFFCVRRCVRSYLICLKYM